MHYVLPLVTCAIVTVIVVMCWNRPRAFVVANAATMATTLGILLLARSEGPLDVWKTVAFAYLGPLIVTGLIIRLRWISQRRVVMLIAVPVAYGIGLFLWLIIAVNLGALQP